MDAMDSPIISGRKASKGKYVILDSDSELSCQSPIKEPRVEQDRNVHQVKRRIKRENDSSCDEKAATGDSEVSVPVSFGTWTCKRCSFRNVSELFNCEMCDMPCVSCDEIESPPTLESLESRFCFTSHRDRWNKSDSNANQTKTHPSSKFKDIKTKQIQRRRQRRRVADTSSEELSKSSSSTDSNDDDDDDQTGSMLDASIGDLASLCITWFNDCTITELSALPYCSESKAVALRRLRPFQDWQDLLNKIESIPRLSANLAWAQLEAFKTQGVIDKILNECNDISKRLRSAAIQDTQNPVPTIPQLLTGESELRPFQKTGLRWLSLLHRHNVNGILADEMGLGKTVQAIAFVAWLMEASPAAGLHLVIVPSSVLDNWLREFSKWTPALQVCCLRGSLKDRAELRRDLK